MLRGGRAMLTVWLFLALLSVGEGTICFEAGPSRGMSTVAEEAGMACVNVTRSSGDPDTFGYRAVAGTAGDDADFIPVPAGARPRDRPLRFQSVSFQNSSLTAEVCVTIVLDEIACELLETISLELNSRGAAVCDDNGFDPLFTVQIEDSTRLPVKFTQSEVRVSETEQTVQVVVEAITGDAFNINSADLRLVEDPNESGCLETGSSQLVQFGCNHPDACTEVGGQQPTMITVSPSLVGDNDISDCHRFCSLVLERSATSQCKFAFPDGNRLSLVVLDDEDVFVSFSTTLAQVREDNGSLALTLQSTRAASQPFTVHLNSRLRPPGDNTATVDDFTPGPYEVTFPANQTSQELNIPITDDELLEADTNDFDVVIVNFTSNCSIRSRPPREVLVQIRDEDRVSVDFPSEPLAALEDSGELAVFLTSTKRSEIGYEVAVRSQQSSGSAAPATDGEDFISATSVVRFVPGNQTSTVALVQLVADSYPEQNETFLLRLTQPAGQEASGMLYNRIDLPVIPATATILNDDPPHEVCFVQPEYRVKEDDGGVDVSVRLNGTTARANITIRISARSTGNGETDASVTPGDDILEAEWVVTILAGENETTFEISVIVDDLAEADEMFELELTVLEEPYFAVPCATESTATVVIVDDDPVMIDVTAVDSRVEGEHQVYEVTFSTQTPFVIPFEITVRPTNGTAAGGEDFESDPITLSFNENRTSVTANIPIINDAIAEEPETFLVIAEPSSSSLTIVINQADSSLMILDNEAIHYFDSVMLTITRNESDGSVPVTVNRRGYIQRESTVLIQPVIGSPPNAAGSEDFAIDPVTVTFAAGEGSVTAAVPLTQDMISELEEQFLLRLIERTSIGGALVEDLVGPPNEATVLIRDPGDNMSHDTAGLCSSEEDSVWGIQWLAIAAGSIRSARCSGEGSTPEHSLAYRRCLAGVPAKWGSVDASKCESVAGRAVRMKTDDFISSLEKFNDTNRDLSDNERKVFQNISRELNVALSPSDERNRSILPQDLKTAVRFVEVVVDLGVNNGLFREESNETEKTVADILSNVLDERNTPAFQATAQTDSTDPERGKAATPAVRILQSTERVANVIATTLSKTKPSFTIARPNLAINSLRFSFNNLRAGIVFPGPGIGDTLASFRNQKDLPQIHLPQSFLRAARGIEAPFEDDTVEVVNVAMNNMENYLPSDVITQDKDVEDEPEETFPASRVISSQILGYNGREVDTKERAQVTFPVNVKSQSLPVPPGMVKKFRCAFFNFSAEVGNQTGGWSYRGVETHVINTTHVRCNASHLTSFAVLVSIVPSVGEPPALDYISYIGCSISLLCLLASIIFYLALRKELIQRLHNFVHLNLCIALSLGLLFFLTGIQTATANSYVCKVMTALLHYFFLATFTWTLCEAVLVYILLVKVFGANDRKWIYLYLVLGWVLPIPVVVITGGARHDYYLIRASFDQSHPHYNLIKACWLPSEKGVIFSFIGPMVAIIVVNAVLLTISLVSLARSQCGRMSSQNDEKRQKYMEVGKQLLKTTIILVPLLGFTWIIGLFAVGEEGKVFAYLFVIGNVFQGLFIFVLHVLRHEKVYGKIKTELQSIRRWVTSLTGSVSNAATKGTHASKSDTIGKKKVSSFALESEGIIEFGVKNNDEEAGSIKEGGNLNIKLNATQEDIEGGENNVTLEMSAATTGALGKEEMMNENSADSHAVQFDMENAKLSCGVATAEEQGGHSDGSVMDTAC